LARSYLEPQYLSEIPSQGFNTHIDILDLLSLYYLTGNETEQARNRFDNLQIGDKAYANETFPEFKARFQNAAIMGRVHESEWFRYMWNKLTPSLRTASAISKINWDNRYPVMVQALTAFDAERRRNNELNPSAGNFQKTSSVSTNKRVNTSHQSGRVPAQIRPDTVNF
jgi:hypothetical protein